MRVKYFCVNNGTGTGLFIIAPIVCTVVLFQVIVLLCSTKCPFKFYYHRADEERVGCGRGSES